MLLSVVYTSLGSRRFTHEELMALLEKAREKNRRLDVTGMLLYKDGAFMQALEGDDATVDRLAEAISRDPRHNAYFICSRQPIERRQFADWSMGFTDLDAGDAGSKVPGYSDFMSQPLTREAIERDPSLVTRLLLMFRN